MWSFNALVSIFQEIEFVDDSLLKVKSYIEVYLEQPVDLMLSLIELDSEETVWKAKLRECKYSLARMHCTFIGTQLFYYAFIMNQLFILVFSLLSLQQLHKVGWAMRVRVTQGMQQALIILSGDLNHYTGSQTPLLHLGDKLWTVVLLQSKMCINK